MAKAQSPPRGSPGVDVRTALVAWVVVMSLLAFVLMAVDKWRSKKGGWRIRERDLLLAALMGGSLGTLAGILILRHKSAKPSFLAGLAGVVALQAGATYLWVR